MCDHPNHRKLIRVALSVTGHKISNPSLIKIVGYFLQSRRQMRFTKSLLVPALLAGASFFITACSDSSGPGDVGPTEALQSLARGFVDGEVSSPTTRTVFDNLARLAPFLDRVTINVGGDNQDMFALGLRLTFPEGTCFETIFAGPDFSPQPGVCTPPVFLVTTVMWQSHAANAPPDKLLLMVSDVGTTEFEVVSDIAGFPAEAIYVAGQNNAWISQSGTLSTQVTSLNQTCGSTLPDYAVSGSCSFASFSENGSIVMEDLQSDATPPPTLTIGIPAATFDGLWLNVAQVQPVTMSVGTKLAPQSLQRFIRSHLRRVER